MKTLEQYINENLDRYPLISYSDDGFKVRLLGKVIITEEGRKSHEKASRGKGKTAIEAFEDALKLC